MLIESSFQIPWDYLERTGELGNREVASQVLLETVETMIMRGERRKLCSRTRTSMPTSALRPNVT